MRSSEKQQFIILILLFAGLIIGEGVFGYFCFTERGEINTVLAKLDKEQHDAEMKIQEIPTLTNKSRELAQIIGEYAKILPREEEARFDAFFEDVGRFIKDSEVRLLLAEPVKRKSTQTKKSKAALGKNTFVRHTYRFELEGTYLQLLKLINKIENHPRFLRVDEINVESKKERGAKKDEEQLAENPTKSIQLVVSTYTYSKSTEEAP